VSALHRSASALAAAARRHLPAPVKQRLRPVARFARRRAPVLLPTDVVAAPASAAEPAPPDVLLRALEHGRSLEEAVVAAVRELGETSQHHRAQALALSLEQQEATHDLGVLAGGVAAFQRDYVELAWDRLSRVPRELWSRYAPGEYLRAGLATSPDAALKDLRALIDDDPAGLGPEQWHALLTPAFGFGAHDLARDAFAVFERHVREQPGAWSDAERQLTWLRPWIEADPGSASAPRPVDGRPLFAVMDYGHPQTGRGSANIGDHVQSIASLGHLVRHRGVRFSGPEPLVGLLEELGERTRPELRRHDVEADVEVMTIHRDASMYESIPEGTWVLCFGWFMHALFRMRYGFPLHHGLRPIFVSFHCNKRELLTPEAIAYLRRYGPVGCRDWSTVYLLLSAGVPAFFSGCLTTTTNTVFPDLEQSPPAEAPVACVDALPQDLTAGCVEYKHSSRAVRTRTFLENVREALDRLDIYRRDHSSVVTSRLHCYLPLRSMGVPVEFRPKNLSDARFDGLIGIDDAAFDAIRTGMLDRLEQVFTAILTGHSEDEVYELWRSLTADEVAAAEARLRREASPAELPAGTATALDDAAAVRVDDGDAADTVHCAVLVGKGRERSLAVLARSLHHHATRPVHLWAVQVSRDVDPDEGLADRFPGLRVTWLDGTELGRALRTPDGSRATADTVARLGLPTLLPDVDRVVLLPLPSVATGDIAALADLDLGRHAVAAPRKEGPDDSGFAVVHRGATRLGRRADLAAELRRRAHACHAYDFDAFTADVLVLDLARLRAEGFGERVLGLVQEFGLRDVEALHVLLGPERADVPPAWATVPTRTSRREPGLLHWADRVKPWHAELTPERECWREQDEALRAAD
jgi:hypothetical protein